MFTDISDRVFNCSNLFIKKIAKIWLVCMMSILLDRTQVELDNFGPLALRDIE